MKPLVCVFALLMMFGLMSVPAIGQDALVVAHRGLLLHAPENTLANFRACLELRLGFEFDVERTKDGQLVCIHDSTVDRTTNGRGKLSELSLSDIRELDAGQWFDPKFASEKVPTVDEVFKLIAEYALHDVLIAVDLKAEGVEREVVQLAVQRGVLHRLLFIGRTISEPQVRENIVQASQDANCAAVANTPEEFEFALSDKLASWVYLRFLPTRRQLDAVHKVNKRAFIAGPTVSQNMPDNWRQAIEAGVDGILTDYPLELRHILKADK